MITYLSFNVEASYSLSLLELKSTKKEKEKVRPNIKAREILPETLYV